MLKAGVTIGCAAAMIVAAVLAVRLRHTRRTPSPRFTNEPFGERLAITVGRAGGMIVGAFLAGVLAIGAGGRLLMRTLAATSSDDVQGLRTEADATIGEVTGGGTLFLVLILGTGAGILGLVLFTLLRRWLPERSLAAGLVGVAIGAGLLVRPAGLLTASNEDFTLVAPAGLAVALCLAILVLFGATFGVAVDHLAPRWPRPGWSLRGVGSVLPFAVLLLAPVLAVATAGAVLLVALAPTGRSEAEQHEPVRPPGDRAGSRVGERLVLALGALGTVSIAVAAGQVLAL